MNNLKVTGFLGAGCVVLMLAAIQASAGGKTETEILYDDFSGGEADYATKWSLPFYGVAGE